MIKSIFSIQDHKVYSCRTVIDGIIEDYNCSYPTCDDYFRELKIQDSYIRRTIMENVTFENCVILSSDCRCSIFKNVSFNNCKFIDVNFSEISFSGCDFFDCLFFHCHFIYCNFRNSRLKNELFRKCRFSENNAYIKQVCPEKGSYIAYKKAYVDISTQKEKKDKEDFFDIFNINYSPVIVELEITEDAKRSSATSNKCRASKCKVLSITNLDGSGKYCSAISEFDKSFVYKVGEIVEVKDFDENRWNECSTGIHHFLNREDAVNYV